MKIIYSQETKFLYGETKCFNNNDTYIFDWNLFDDDETAFENLKLKINQQSLLNDYKNYLVKNCSIFTKSKISKFINHIKDIDGYKKNIIFILEANTLDLPKELCNMFEIKNIPKINYWSMNTYIDKYIKDNNIKIDDQATIEFKSMMIQDLWVLDNELKKLTFAEGQINKQWVQENINDYNNETLFKMVQHYLKNNITSALNIYQNYYNSKKSTDEIINVMVSYVFKLKVIYNYIQINSINSIKKEFGLLDFQDKEINDIMKYIDINKLNTLLNNLLKLDKGIKSGKIDGYNQLKLILLGVDHGC